MPHPTPAPMFHRTMSLGGSPMPVTPLQTTFGPVFEPRVYHLMAHCPRQTKRKINKKMARFRARCANLFAGIFVTFLPPLSAWWFDIKYVCTPLSGWVGGSVSVCVCEHGCVHRILRCKFHRSQRPQKSVPHNISNVMYEHSACVIQLNCVAIVFLKFSF